MIYPQTQNENNGNLNQLPRAEEQPLVTNTHPVHRFAEIASGDFASAIPIRQQTNPRIVRGKSQLALTKRNISKV